MVETCNALPHLEVARHDAHLHREFVSSLPPPQTPTRPLTKIKHPDTLIGVMLILCSKSGCNLAKTVGAACQTNPQTPVHEL